MKPVARRVGLLGDDGRLGDLACVLLLLLLLAAHTAAVYFWGLTLADSSRGQDGAVHFSRFGEVLRLWEAGSDAPWPVRAIEILQGETWHDFIWPRLTYLVTAWLVPLLGYNVGTVLAGQAIFLGIWCFSTYFLARGLLEPTGSFLAAGMLLVLPDVWWHSRTLLLDLPAASLAVLALLALVRSRGFRRTIPSLLFALVAFLAVKAKPTSLLLLAPAVLYATGVMLASMSRIGPRFVKPDLNESGDRGWARGPGGRTPRRLLNALAAGVLFTLALVLTFPGTDVDFWHVIVLTLGRYLQDWGAVQGYVPPALYLPPFTPAWLFYFFADLAVGTGPPLLVCAALVLGLHARRRPWSRTARYLAVTFAGTWLLYTVFANKELRYFAGVLTPVTIAAAAVLTRLFQPKVAVLVLVLMLEVTHLRFGDFDKYVWEAFSLHMDVRQVEVVRRDEIGVEPVLVHSWLTEIPERDGAVPRIATYWLYQLPYDLVAGAVFNSIRFARPEWVLDLRWGSACSLEDVEGYDHVLSLGPLANATACLDALAGEFEVSEELRLPSAEIGEMPARLLLRRNRGRPEAGQEANR